MKRTLIAAAFCAAFAGSAFAQQTDGGSGASPDYFSDPAMVGTFYTDDTMATLRPVEEMRAAYDALGEDERAALQQQCEQEANRGTDATALCSEVTTYQ
ncbi:hypothetical protein FY036_13410 [Mesorhizobium microcysteis]|jgi:hypothetical protein|uniref:Secreted protein n=1 Tax=Neoaquamicrobium microcysteis TaxID=2682781 RepID=A0A5D4GUL9_9HYPH|nr:hypothetical protein [Mesorhizobium microcysteis]TYR32077.1 hypothetical protein FY036_13410 [Mesorhizobium microcysteis]